MRRSVDPNAAETSYRKHISSQPPRAEPAPKPPATRRRTPPGPRHRATAVGHRQAATAKLRHRPKRTKRHGSCRQPLAPLRASNVSHSSGRFRSPLPRRGRYGTRDTPRVAHGRPGCPTWSACSFGRPCPGLSLGSGPRRYGVRDPGRNATGRRRGRCALPEPPALRREPPPLEGGTWPPPSRRVPPCSPVAGPSRPWRRGHR